MTEPERPTLAFYYPGVVWADTGWLKNMLMFFDGIALLVPAYLRESLDQGDASLLLGLQGHELLHILDPAEVVTADVARAVESVVTQFVRTHADSSSRKRPPGQLSLSRFGALADDLGLRLIYDLQRRGLAGAIHDGRSVEVDSELRDVILAALAYAIPALTPGASYALSPATDRPWDYAQFVQALGSVSSPTPDRVVACDFGVVGADLSSVPLEELLEYRESRGAAYRAYARDVRAFAAELARVPSPDREVLLADRRDALTDEARALARHTRKWWAKPASVALGIGGAAWSIKTGDLVGGLIATGTAGLAAASVESPSITAHSFLLGVRDIAPRERRPREPPAPTQRMPRGVRRTVAARAGITPLQLRQLETLAISGASLPASETVPKESIAASAAASDGLKGLEQLGLVRRKGLADEIRWELTSAGANIANQTRT